MTEARYTIPLVVLFAAGCGGGLPPMMDQDEARAALTAALDAWKEGKPPESMRERKPPVDFRDVNRESGSKLSRYLVKGEERSGVSVRITVQLVLDQKGKSVERVVVYNVDAGPTIVIRPNF